MQVFEDVFFKTYTRFQVIPFFRLLRYYVITLLGYYVITLLGYWVIRLLGWLVLGS